MDTNLSPAQVAAWMREQAAHFSKMAEQIENTFRLNGQASVAPSALVDNTADVAKKMETALLDGRQRRAPELAKIAHVPEEEVRRISVQDRRFVRNDRGWIKLRLLIH